VQELVGGEVRVSEVRGVAGVGIGGEVRGKPGAVVDRRWAAVEKGGAARHRPAMPAAGGGGGRLRRGDLVLGGRR
jgi:hypothetical protein